ncbi:hypothetical protein [Neobacillus sp. Marseille-QA0830]
MIYFAILAHDNERVLAEQIKNIRFFNPNAKIVLYNGGTDTQFGQSLGLPICPYSRPLRWGNLTPYLFDIMRWLEETEADYDYLVNLDHDVLFIKHGFESFLEEFMKDYDCMGSYFHIQHAPTDYPEFGPGISMWSEWEKWKPIFKTDYFARYFNPGQVYRHSIIKKMLSEINIDQLELLWPATNVVALEEMFFVTLAMSKGAKCREYPWLRKECTQYVFYQEDISLDKVKEAQKHPDYFWIHPVKGESLITMNRYLIRE